MRLALSCAACAISTGELYAQEPTLAVTTPNLSALGYSGDFGHDLDGLGDAAGVKAGDILIAAPLEPPNTRYGRAYLMDGTTGLLLQTFSSPNQALQGRFGEAVSRVPDVDGDGLDDILIGAPKEAAGPTGAGHAYLYRRPSGSTASAAQLLLTLTSPAPETVGGFGFDVAGVGDVNGDGFGELLIGAYREDGGKLDAGRAYLFDGATGALLWTLVSPSPKKQGHFGRSVAGVPDVDGDGVDDLVVGEPRDLDSFPQGSVFVFSGATGALVRTLVAPVPGFATLGFGLALAGVPDLNADGRGEVFVGSPNSAGAARLYSGLDGSLMHTFPSVSGQGQGAFGTSLASTGDTNGDGVAELIVGAPGEFDTAISAGRAYVFSGADFQLLSTLEAPDPQPLGFPVAGNNFGRGVAGLPDANADGLGEYLVGAPGLDLSGPGSGAGFAFFCTTEVEAKMFTRLGTPPNPPAFTSSSQPIIGHVWSASVDHSSFESMATLDLMLLAGTTVNLPGPDGTLLVPLGPSTLVYARPAGLPFAFVVPAECSLVGAQLAAQGISFDGAHFAAANALDLVIGSH